MKRELRELELIIHVPPGAADPVVDMHVMPDDVRASGQFAAPLSTEEIASARQFMAAGLLDTDAVRDIGTRLFSALFSGPTELLYRDVVARPGAVRVRLIVDTNGSAAEQALVPWELAYDPVRGVFIALDGSFVRGIATTTPVNPTGTGARLRVLAVESFPAGLATEEGSQEPISVVSSLYGANGVSVSVLTDATLSGIQDALRSSVEPFQVLHVVCHGQADQHGSALLLCDGAGGVDAVSPEAFANVLRGRDLGLVFLNACESVSLDTPSAFAPALLSLGIPAVIGMQTRVRDVEAVRVAREFYSSIADGSPIDVALTDARRLVRGKRVRHASDLAIPVCYLRDDDGVLFLLAKRAPRPLAIAGLAALGLVAASAVGWQIAHRESFHPPPGWDRSVRAIVAQFEEKTGEGRAASGTGKALTSNIAMLLERRLTESDRSGVAPIKFAVAVDRRVRGPSAVEQGTAALTRLKKRNAHLIMYGEYRCGDLNTTVTAHYRLITENEGFNLDNAPELTAQVLTRKLVIDQTCDRLKSRVPPSNLSDIATKGADLLAVSAAIHAYNDGQYGTASQALERIGSGHAADDLDLSVAAVLAGNAEILLSNADQLKRTAHLEAAERFYNMAIKIDPSRARAHRGIGEVLFNRACNGESGDVISLLQQAEVQIKLTGGVESTSDEQINRHYGLARVEVCRLAKLGDRLAGERALEHLGWVINKFEAIVEHAEAEKQHLRRSASNAYALRAQLSMSMGGGAPTVRVIADASRAVELSIDDVALGAKASTRLRYQVLHCATLTRAASAPSGPMPDYCNTNSANPPT